MGQVTSTKIQELNNATREEANAFLEQNNGTRYLGKELPKLSDNQVFVARCSVSGQGHTFFVREVDNQIWFDAYKSKDFRSKEFHILTVE